MQGGMKTISTKKGRENRIPAIFPANIL